MYPKSLSTMRLVYLAVLLASAHAFHVSTSRNVCHVGPHQFKQTTPSFLVPKNQVGRMPLVSLGVSDDNDASAQDEKMAKKVKGRESRAINGYKIASISFLALTPVMTKLTGIRASETPEQGNLHWHMKTPVLSDEHGTTQENNVRLKHTQPVIKSHVN